MAEVLLNQTNLVVSLGFFGDPIVTEGTISPPVAGTDTSIFANSTFYPGIIPPITEHEWMEAWSAITEFEILFRAPFLAQPTSISPWGWAVPPEFDTPAKTADTRLWVPSIRQISQFLLRAPAFSPTSPGGWARLMETALVGVINEGAYVPFTAALLEKYEVPRTGITIKAPNNIGALFTAGPSGYLGSFVLNGTNNAPHDVVLLEDRAHNVITGLEVTPTRCQFIPSFSSKGMLSLLGTLGMSAQVADLLELRWRPVAEPPTRFTPGPLTTLDFAATEDSVLRMAFGGEAPPDAVFEGLLRGTVPASAAYTSPFMSSPLSLLFFEKAIVKHVASVASYPDEEKPSHSYGKAQFATDVPADPEVPGSEPSVKYSPATVRIPGRRKVFTDEYQKYNRTGYYLYDASSGKCPEEEGGAAPPPEIEHIDLPIDESGNYEVGDSGAAYWDSLLELYNEVSTTGEPSTEVYSRTFAVTLTTRVDELTASYASTSAADQSYECSYGGSAKFTSASDQLEEFDNAHKMCDAVVDIPTDVFPATATPWTSTVFDLLKGTIGEDELTFLVGNNLIGKVRLYISVWCSELSALSGAQKRTYTSTHEFHQFNGQPPSSSDPGPVEDSVSEPGYPTTPISSAEKLLDPIISAMQMSEQTPLLPSDALAQCENGGGEFFESDQPLPINNSISVGGFGPFAHRSVLLWEGEDLQETVSEAELWGTIAAETQLIAGIEAIAGLPPGITKSTTTFNLTNSYSSSDNGNTSSGDSSQIYSFETTRTTGGARLKFAMGDIYFKVDYKFSHYRNPPPA